MTAESPDEMEADTPPQISPNNMRVSVNNNKINPPLSPDRVCKVCGDRAVGYNFGVISCESCKAFFRRNAYREEEIRCPFASSCEINKDSRRFCQSCRLQKCLRIGMKRDSGWSDKGSTSANQQPLRKRHYKACSTTSTPLNEIDNIEVNDEGAVTIPKHVYENLVRKAQSTSEKGPRECTCSCICGFYPPDTRLVAKEEIQNPASATSSEANSVPQQPYKSPEENSPFYPSSSTYAPAPPRSMPLATSNTSHMLSLLESPLNPNANFMNSRLTTGNGSYSGSWYGNVPLQDTNQYMMDITGMANQRSPVGLNPPPQTLLNQYNAFPLVTPSRTVNADDYRPRITWWGITWWIYSCGIGLCDVDVDPAARRGQAQ
uniref:Nuclear receptor domain-containing protein n=1 Tax=Panagrellus redivivus TaxID=6233 RepID=A0A7E4V9Z4_PANRE